MNKKKQKREREKEQFNFTKKTEAKVLRTYFMLYYMYAYLSIYIILCMYSRLIKIVPMTCHKNKID